MADSELTLDLGVKNRRFGPKDFNRIAEFVRQTHKQRENDSRRKTMEAVWTAVDRQIRLEALVASDRDPKVDDDWHSAIELGLLSKSSEILTADAMRLLFPNSREWFEPHQDLREDNAPVEQEVQEKSDRALRSFMSQQHRDFGLQSNIKLSIKEIMHHGCMVAEVFPKRLTNVHKGKGIQQSVAPIWQPHSMWNCFPDPSMTINGTNLFYEGSMIIQSFMKKHEVLQKKEWINRDKIRKKQVDENKDLKVLKYFGPLFIERQRGGDIFLPNMKVIIVDDVFVFGKAIEFPFSPIIYTGYERFDPRNPYYLSPIMKMSPMQTLATTLSNQFVDWGALTVEPPIMYNAASPEMARSGGPEMKPGVRTPVTGPADFKEIRTGDGGPILEAMQFIFQGIEEGTAVDANRSGVAAGTEQTATEIRSNRQRGELRISDFVTEFEGQGINSFLYMQHEINKTSLDEKGYLFYNENPGAADYQVMKRADLADNVVFDIVGSRGVLGEIQRGQAVMEVTKFIKDQEAMQGITRDDEIAIMLYGDAGVKNPEKLLRINDSDANPDPQVVELQLALEQAIEAGQEVQEKFQEDAAKLQEMVVELEGKNRDLEGKVQKTEIEVARERLNTANERNERRGAEDELRIVKQVGMSKAEMYKIVETIRKEKDKSCEGVTVNKGSEGKNSNTKSSLHSINLNIENGPSKSIEITPTEDGGFVGTSKPIDKKLDS